MACARQTRHCDLPAADPGSPATLADVLDSNGLFDREQVERARRYHRPLYMAAAAGIALNLCVLALLAFTAFGDRLYATTRGWPWWARGLAFGLLVVALTTAVALPITFWTGYLHEHAWGFSRQSAAGWLLDRLKGLAVNLVLSGGALLGLVAAARAWPASRSPASSKLCRKSRKAPAEKSNVPNSPLRLRQSSRCRHRAGIARRLRRVPKWSVRLQKSGQTSWSSIKLASTKTSSRSGSIQSP